MDKFFEVLKKLRPGVQEGKITRDRAKDILMQESGVSEQLASKAADNMLATNPEVSGGITEVFFGPGDPRLGGGKKRNLPEPDNPSVEERTGGLLKEGRDYKIGEDGEYISLKNQETGIDPSIMSLGNKESFEYEMALYRQRRERKMEPVYKKYGAVTERDKNLVDEYIDIDSEDNLVFSTSNPKYDKATASIFIQESVEEVAGQAGADTAANILYGRVAENILADDGLDAYIDHAFKELKKEGLSFNKNLLKTILKERYNFKDGGRTGFKDGKGITKMASVDEPFYRNSGADRDEHSFRMFNKPYKELNADELEEFQEEMMRLMNKFRAADGGRAGFKEGTGRKGILSALKDKLNEIAPGSTNVGKVTKVSDKAKRREMEREMIEDINRFSRTYPRTPEKAGQGQFTKAEVLEQIIKNTIKDLGDDPEVGEYIKKVYPGFLKEIKAKPELANNENVFRNLTEQLVNNPKQRLVVYDDDTVDFFTRGEKRGMGSVKALADELGISMEEAAKIKMMEPEDQVLELTKMRRLKDKNRKLNAGGGLNYLMGL